MKNALFAIIAFAIFSFNGIAQTKSDINQKAAFKSASLITTFENEVTEYKFLSLAELNEEADQIMQELIFTDSQNTNKRPPEITIEIQIEITIGAIKGLLCGLIITNCADVIDATKKLKAMLLAAATLD
ncbi:hypothetical protein [Flavobacterium sp.]|uniref:hypothetical protein n=1 Tax=Flavobacterium sp. TaxID=239 RepID=UPI0025EC4E41|nr:hypothetical protein [Flavobacterium sp.]